MAYPFDRVTNMHQPEHPSYSSIPVTHGDTRCRARIVFAKHGEMMVEGQIDKTHGQSVLFRYWDEAGYAGAWLHVRDIERPQDRPPETN
ncbi:hypothetical protein [Luteipulveratus mongoliensis]|uniref:Uncharacterized protein n=1 Tax=Luteipulveratus mongoliensis TaxID=571913 RepID=A0A0K1JGA4_9MICO|nr:hypothetical protein [Luteipulveratus mongoliensis]AKU15729.1 hypothetical protein VV02_07480 [Luteipulveratus mongoliensis]